MTPSKVLIVRDHPAIYNFQKCSLNVSQCLLQVQEQDELKIEYYASLSLQEQNLQVLIRIPRLNKVNTLSNNQQQQHVIKCDLRVLQLVSNYPPIHAPIHAGEEFISVPTTREVDLAHLVLKCNTNANFKLDLRHYLRSTGVKPMWCLPSNDLKILKPGTIKEMICTVISSCDLNLFNSLLLEEGQGQGQDLQVQKTPGKWKVLREKIRDIFQINHIHTRSSTLIDLQTCPLSTILPYPVQFVYVEECTINNPAGEIADETESIGRVDSQTNIVIKTLHHISYYFRQIESYAVHQKPTLFGLEEPIEIINKSIKMRLELSHKQKKCISNSHSMIKIPHGLLIAGSSGCGKTACVRESAKKLQCELLICDISSFDSETQDSRIKNMTDVFERALLISCKYPTILLIENIDSLHLPEGGGGANDETPAGGKSSISISPKNSMKRKIIDHLASFLDSLSNGNNLLLTTIATAIKPHLIPGKLRRSGRLDQEVYIKAPNEGERLQILRHITKDNLAFEATDVESLSKKTPGYVGSDLLRLTHLALLKSNEEDLLKVNEDHIKYALTRVLPSVLGGSLGVVDVQRGISLDNIAGLESVKLDLIKAIIWPLRHPRAFLNMGILPPKGVLLYGPPGCAKTTLVKAIASSYHTNFLSVSAAELFSSGFGDSEKIIAQLFHQARMASPCILFIDELESIVGSRQNSKSKGKSTNEAILAALLTEMDGIGIKSETISNSSSKNDSEFNLPGPRVIVVGATNKPSLIDTALLRPGRFDRVIPVHPPDEKGRKELFEKCSSNTPLGSNVDFEFLAKETHNYSGADIVNLFREAALFALSEDMNIQSLSMEHFIKAKDRLTPSLTSESLRSFYEYANFSKTEFT